MKNFCEDLFFFGEHLRLCPWPWPRAFLSLASRGSVLGRAVLGLEPCVLDSSSANSLENCGFGGKNKNQSFQKLFGGYLFVFVKYLCNRSPKIKTTNIKNCSSILAIVSHRDWLDDSPHLKAVNHPANSGDLR